MTLVRNSSLNAFGSCLFKDAAEETAAACCPEGAGRIHAAVEFIISSLENHHLAGAFICPCQKVSKHDAGSTGSDCLGNIAGITHAAVGNDGDARFFAVINGCHLRNAYACNDARRSHRSRAYSDLHIRSAGFNESLCRIIGRSISCNDFCIRSGFPEISYDFKRPLSASVESFHEEHVSACFKECSSAFFCIIGRSGRCTDEKASFLILHCIRVFLCLFYITDCDQTLQVTLAVNERQLFNAVCLQDLLRITKRCMFRSRYKAFRSHDFADRF